MWTRTAAKRSLLRAAARWKGRERERTRPNGSPIWRCKRAETQACKDSGDLNRQLVDLGHEFTVVAPSLIPKRSGDRVKTNRRDAVSLARLHRAGELTAVCIPETAHQAIRDLVRARANANIVLTKAGQHLQSYLLRHGRIYTGRASWARAHSRWPAALSFVHPTLHIVSTALTLLP